MNGTTLDEWQPEPAELRDGETTDDNSHARRNAEQLAMADDLETDGGVTAAPRWTPHNATPGGVVCQNCEEPHTKQFARVFGSNEGVLYHCPECPDICYRDMNRRAGANPDYDPETDRGETSENLPLFNGGA